MDMVPVEGAALVVPSSTSPFPGSLGSAIAQRDQLVLLQQGLLQGLLYSNVLPPKQSLGWHVLRSKVHGTFLLALPAGSCPCFGHTQTGQARDPARQSLDATRFTSGKGSAYPCSKGGERGTTATGSGAGRDMLAVCPSPGTRAVKRTARKEQPLLTHNCLLQGNSLFMPGKGKFSNFSFFFNSRLFIKKNF